MLLLLYLKTDVVLIKPLLLQAIPFSLLFTDEPLLFILCFYY